MMRNILIFLLVLIVLMTMFRTWKREEKRLNLPKRVVVRDEEMQEVDRIGEQTRSGKRVTFSEQEDIRVFDGTMPPYSVSDLNYGPRQMDALDRVRNPLRYPYKSVPQFQTPMVVGMDNLPFQVMGGGRRNIPALNRGDAPMINPPVSIDVGPQNIAPVNVSVRGPIGLPQRCGALIKVFGDQNDTLGLYCRKRFPRSDKYDYYTILGKDDVKLRVQNVNRNQRFDELSSGDEVYIEGFKDRYRVVSYQTDFPQYI